MLSKNLIVLLSFVFSIYDTTILNEKKRLFKRSPVGPVWPTKRIPYSFSNIIEFDFKERVIIEQAIKMFEISLAIDGDVCIEFVPRKNETDYILFVDTGDCSSSLGYYPGQNRISLSKYCYQIGTIMHELMHRLGFDHEHSRADRDEHIQILKDNSNQKSHSNFDKNTDAKLEDFDTPYDYYSVTHYNSDAMQKSNDKPTILSKIPALVNDNFKLFHSRETTSPIDIYKIQSLYHCQLMKTPLIMRNVLDESTKDLVETRFRTEAKFRGIATNIIDKYLSKTYTTCGSNHFWPSDYPLVDSKHPLYTLICQEKKELNGECKFSFECLNHQAACVRFMFKKTGSCVQIDNDQINKVKNTINDSMFKIGKTVKDTWETSVNKFKNIFG